MLLKTPHGSWFTCACRQCRRHGPIDELMRRMCRAKEREDTRKEIRAELEER
jgi:hypothetical protein